MHLSIKQRLEMKLAGYPVPPIIEPKITKIPQKFKRTNYERKFDDEQITLIRSLYHSQSYSYRKLAAEFGTCRATIEHIIRGEGAYGPRQAVKVRTSTRIFDDEQIALIRSLYQSQPYSIKKLAVAFGVGTTTIGNIIRGEGAYKPKHDPTNFATNW